MARYIPGFGVSPIEIVSIGSLPIDPVIQTLVVGGVIFALANMITWPISQVIGALLPLVTSAMVAVAVNAVFLFIADLYLPELAISGFRPLISGAFLLGIVNSIL